MGRFVKLLFVVFYATVLVGIIFSALFILSSLVSGSSSDAIGGSWLSSSMLSSSLSQLGSGSLLRLGASDEDTLWTRAIWDPPPAGSKMPPLEMFRLTKERVGHRAKDNVVVVTFGNHAFIDFVLNWVMHLTHVNVSNLLVGAMDAKLLEALYWKGVPVFNMNIGMQANDVGWGSPAFHKIGREKVLLINAFLPFGYELLLCDTDVVWFKNPLPYLSRYPEADILTSTDLVSPSITDDGLEVWNEAHAAFNIGVFHWRPTIPSMKLAKEWRELLVADDKIWDQNGFNDLLRKVLGPSAGDNGLVYTFDGSLKLGILPTSIFCSGHTFFVQDMARQLKLEPYAVHTTFQYAGSDGKRHRMREAMAFYDPPEYYDSPGGFMSFRPRIPKYLFLDGNHTVDTHFALVNYQMKQIRTALAVASLLNRTLVMPTLWCRLDRMWFGHPGVLPSTFTRQPFVCPMDHVFEVSNMGNALSEAEFGPKIDFREYSFLNNPSLPEQVKKSKLEVRVCAENSATCNTSVPGVVKLPKDSSEEAILRLMSPHKDIKIIEFSSMQGVFTAFADKGREEKFRKRVKRYTSIWCCVENRTPGHIFYDMYWDEKPGWRPHPPDKKEDDQPPW